MQSMSSYLSICALLILTGCTTDYGLDGQTERLDPDVSDDSDTGTPEQDTDPDTDAENDTDTDPIVEESIACPYVSENQTGQVFYVDPIHGDSNNDGSQDSPWRSLQQVIDDYVDCTDQHGTPHHSNAPIQGGDTIVLVGADGHDSSIDITGCFNSDYVAIQSETLHQAKLSALHIRGGAYWEFDGIAFEKSGGAAIIRAELHSHHGPTHHLNILNTTMTSGNLQTKQDYADKAVGGIDLKAVDHTAIICNRMVKIGKGIGASGDYIDVLHNTIEFFSRDAIVNGGDYNRYLHNRVYDSVKLGDGHHDDFFQSHRGSHDDTSTGLEIGYNLMMNRYSDAQPDDTKGPTQCIGAFGDGPKTGIHLFNNVCKTDHHHGLTWTDTNDSIIVNNTIVGGSDFPGYARDHGFSPEASWINVSGSGNIVQNNLVSKNYAGGEHNIVITPDQVNTWFTDWSGGDLTLRADAPAVDAGDTAHAPADDILGNPRDSQPDVGAYEVQLGD